MPTVERKQQTPLVEMTMTNDEARGNGRIRSSAEQDCYRDAVATHSEGLDAAGGLPWLRNPVPGWRSCTAHAVPGLGMVPSWQPRIARIDTNTRDANFPQHSSNSCYSWSTNTAGGNDE